MNYSISEEQLQSLESDYMTKDTIAIIAKAVRSGAPTVETHAMTLESKLAQIEILKELYAWIQWNNTADNPTRYEIMPYSQFDEGGNAYNAVSDKIIEIQRRTLPIDAERYNMTWSDSSDPIDFLLEDRR